MSLVEINWSPGPREIRSFGRVFAIGLTLMVLAGWLIRGGGLVLLRHGRVELGASAMVTIGVAWTVALIAQVSPRLARPFYFAWMAVAFVLGTISSAILMAVLYYALFTPMAAFFRLIRRDVLRRKWPANNNESFWHPVPTEAGTKQYHRQF